jgi:hypothetical protein
MKNELEGSIEFGQTMHTVKLSCSGQQLQGEGHNLVNIIKSNQIIV